MNDSGNYFWSFSALALSVGLKVLLFPAYHSTDFEVHRNWLAITNNLDISRWYYEDTSEWTLDYPPFFAWFEFFMSQIVKLIDHNIVKLQNYDYATTSCIFVHRSTVIISEFVLFYALYRFVQINKKSSQSKIIAFLVYFCPGFLIVDHVHFQYNGFLFGILILSINYALQENDLASAALFTVLLNFKHIFVYIAPAYFVYFLCRSFQEKSTFQALVYLSKVGFVVVSITLASFGPFIYMNQIPQLISRLFPFKRGLSHAYWAPNFWALYTIVDRVLIKAFKVLKVTSMVSSVSSNTRGIVGNTEFGVLPDIKPSWTFMITIVSQLPYLAWVWKNPRPKNLIVAIAGCGLSSFMFGWHVHEKAVLLYLIPQCLGLLSPNTENIKISLISGVSGLFGLFPLLYGYQERPLNYCFLSGWILIFTLLKLNTKSQRKGTTICDSFNFSEKLYLAGFIPLSVYYELGHYLIFKDGMQFLPLALVSIYCAIGTLYSFVCFTLFWKL